jgi:hypothetical protein
MGISSKFSTGGGEGIVHSSVFPPHGSDGAFIPFLREANRLIIIIARPE